MSTTSETQTSGTAATGDAAKKTEIVTSDGTPNKILSAPTESGRTDMPVSAVARLLGVATATDLSLLEGKLDLAIGKLNMIQMRVEKMLTTITGMPSGADLERIDVQIGSLKTAIRDALAGVVGERSTDTKKDNNSAE